MENFLANAANKLLIVCEIKPWEIGKLGYTMKDFAAQLKRFGYAVFEMDDPRKRVDLATMVDMETLMFRAELR